MIEIKLINKADNFLKIKETLTRIGIANAQEQKIFQSCNILYRMGKYYIAHFKELLRLDGHDVEIVEEDLDRRDDIVALLVEWKLCTTVEPLDNPKHNYFRVIPFRDKHTWTLVPKYQF